MAANGGVGGNAKSYLAAALWRRSWLCRNIWRLIWRGVKAADCQS